MRRIIIGSLFAVCLLLFVPAIPAMKYNMVMKENTKSFVEQMQWIDSNELREKLNGGLGLLELFIAFLMLLYIELGVIFDRSFTLILLLALVLYKIGILLGLIDEPTPLV